MELDGSLLADLPDAALYHLLMLCNLEQLAKFETVLGKQRTPIFAEVTKEMGKKYLLEGLSLSALHRIVDEEDKSKSAQLALAEGDYVTYIESILDSLTNFDELFEYAAKHRREESALLLLKLALKDATPRPDILLEISIHNRCTSCLSLLAARESFSDVVIDFIYGGYDNYSKEDMIWFVRKGKVTVTNDIITDLLENQDMECMDLLRILLKKAGDDEVRTAYADHLQNLDLGQTPFQGAYGADETVTQLFKDRLGL